MRNVWILGLILAGSAIASSLAVEFGGETSQVDSYSEAGKLWAQSEALALALGVRTDAAPAGGKLTFRLGKSISYTAPITLRGKQPYVIALEVARNLGYTATLLGDGSRLVLKYEKKVRCEDFEFQEQAQRFYRAASPQAFNQMDRDPYRLDNDADGKACESLPDQFK